MSYLDPLGRPTAPADWPDETDGDERDARHWARHSGAAPDPYADAPWRVDSRNTGSWDGGRAAYPSLPASDSDADHPGDPLWNRPTEAAAPELPAPAGPTATAEPAFVSESGPLAEADAVAIHRALAEETAGEPQRPRGPGRRRASRSRRPVAVPAGPGRAGRNLPAAIGVGAGLVGLVLVSLLIEPLLFTGVVAAAACVGIWEMVRALQVSGARPPMVPLLGGGVLMIGLAAYAGPDALALGLLVTVLAALVWRLGDGPRGFQRDATATALIAVYVPFLLGFGVLLANAPDGAWRVLGSLAAVVLSDTGGYAFGVFLGKHPMAPSVSPKKSWEGFAGSVFAAAVGSAVLLWLLLDIQPWQGALFGAAIAVVAVIGDLAESMLKRDLGIKDMSQLLPGHGGLMDRLDSILFAVPTAYLLLSLLKPLG